MKNERQNYTLISQVKEWNSSRYCKNMKVNPTDIQDNKIQSYPIEKEIRNRKVLAWTTLSQRLHGFHLLSFLLSLLFPRPPSETPLSLFLSFPSFSLPFLFFSPLPFFFLLLSLSLCLSFPPTNPVFFTCSLFNMQSLNQYIFLAHYPKM